MILRAPPASSLRRLLVAVLLLALGGTGLALSFPSLMGAYHLEVGGRAMQNPPSALEHLGQAIRWQPDNAQAYRLLGQVYRAKGDWPAALEAQARYTELRPRNPLGYVELAELCEQIESLMAAMKFGDLIALLPKAAVRTPDVPLDTPYGRPGGPVRDYYVAGTVFNLAPDYAERPTLFMHAPSWVSYTLALPAQPAFLRFDMGMDPRTFDWPGDGVTFELLVNGERVFLEHLDKETARQGWRRRVLDLTPWAGQGVVLVLGTTSGPAGDTTGDWAGWGEPQVVDKKLPEMEALNPGPCMVGAWKQAGYTALGLISLGDQARKRKELDEAQGWYERAARLEPDLGDPWYRLGILYEGQEEWPLALAAYTRATEFNRYEQVSGSDLHCRLATIYGWRLDPKRPAKARKAYITALELDDFVTPADAAECNYLYGFVQREQGAPPDQYIDEFQRAVELNSKHAWAHMMLGVAIYERDRDAERAQAEILRALELAPENKWAYYHLGEIYRQQERIDEAVAMYQHALQIDPGFEAAQAGLRRSQPANRD